jgi:hypothetical protein
MQDEVPHALYAHDGIEEQERMIEKDVEDALVRIVNMNLKLGQRSGVVQHGHNWP